MRFGFRPLSSVIKWLIISNVLVYLLQQGFYLVDVFGLTPQVFYTEFPNRLFQPLSYMFLHGGFFHILINMLFLWMFGSEIEGMWGPRRFLRFYILSGLGGALFSLVFNYESLSPIIGASGAVFGVMIAYWRYFPDRRLYLYFVIPVKVRYAIPGMLFVPMLVTMSSTDGNIAHLAHLGGAVIGFILTRSMAQGATSSRRGSLSDWLSRRKHEKLTAKFESNRQQAQDVMKRVDSILDRINEVGLENISDEDRKFLEEASERLSGNEQKPQ